MLLVILSLFHKLHVVLVKKNTNNGEFTILNLRVIHPLDYGLRQEKCHPEGNTALYLPVAVSPSPKMCMRADALYLVYDNHLYRNSTFPNLRVKQGNDLCVFVNISSLIE